MLEICLSERSYSIKGKTIALAKSNINSIFFMKLLPTLSKPFAIIVAAGNNKNNNSVLFLFGISKAKAKATSKFIIKRIQLFLNEFFTENAFGDFKNIAITESARINAIIQ